MFQDQNVGLRFIDISNIILKGPTVTNYRILPVVSISGLINLKSLVATFTGGSKIYDKTQIPGPILNSISGMVSTEIIFISSFKSYFPNFKAGNRFIDISNITLSGYLPSNYYVLPVGALASYIYQRPLTITFSDGNKIYDGNRIPSFTFIGTISNVILTDNIILSTSYDANFRSSNAGPQFIDVSNVSILGSDINNYYILPVVPTDAYIYYRYITAIFTNGNKIYDGTTNIYALKYSINGLVNNDKITISSYYAQFKNPNAGNQFIDISYTILYGPAAQNYILNPIPSLLGYIYLKNIYASFSGGDKIYDKTLIPSLTLFGTLSGIVNTENIIIISFTSKYNSYLVGLNRIDVSNVILGGTTATNYLLQPIIPNYATISKRSSLVTFNGGNKIYDSNTVPGPINSYISNLIPSDYVTVDYLLATYTTPNVGLNNIIVNTVVINTIDSLNYDFTIQQTISGIISPKQIQAIFTGGNKIYNRTFDTGSISGYLVNTVLNDNIFINSFSSKYRNYTIGRQIIDISNIVLGGTSSQNYLLDPVLPINGTIFVAPLLALFTCSDKIYDATRNVNNINYVLNTVYPGDQVYLSSYNAFYFNSNAGYRRVDISNAIITGIDSYNYRLLPINSIYSNIIQRSLTINFFNGNKIYDATNNVYNLLYSISGVVPSENIIVNAYLAYFRNLNVGIQIIDVSNIVLIGSNPSNYIINPILPFSAIISQKSIRIIFTNLNKIYDGTQNIIYYTISSQIVGLAGNDLLTISSFTGLYKNSQVGNVLLDISNIILFGRTLGNYNLQPNGSLNGIIFKRLLNILFYGGDKVYDGTFQTGDLGYEISNIANNENIIVLNYNSLFRKYTIGLQIIDISNIIIFGPTTNNYYLLNQPPISAYIYPQNVSVSFTGIDKIYDNTRNAYVSNSQIYGLIPSDISNVTISSYKSNYINKFVENNKTIYVTDIILTGNNSQNYIIGQPTVLTYSNISPLQIYLFGTGVTKIYDQTTNANLSNVYLSGYFFTDTSFISISSYISNYIDINAEYNKTINITDIILGGPYAFNYYVNSTTTIGNILRKTVPTYFTGINKIFDGTVLASVTNITISNIIYPDTTFISSYNANFIDPNVGINKTIIVTDISFSGFSGINYRSDPSYTFATITNPTSLNITLTSNNILYRDISNYVSISINPLWIGIPTNINSTLNGIYQNIIISSNGQVYNLINNILVPIYSSNYFFTNLAMNDINNGFICGLSGLIISTTNGFNTQNINILSNYNFNSVSLVNNRIAFLVGNNGIIYRTSNIGVTWNLINSPTTTNLNDVSIITSNIVFIIGNNGLLLTSTNGGANWTQNIISTQNLNSIAMVDQNNGYIVGDNGTMLRTNDGRNWTPMYDLSNNKYTNYNLNNVVVLNTNDVMIVGDNGTILRSNNRGINWFFYTSGTNLKLTKIFMYTSTYVNVIGINGLILTFNLNPGGLIKLYDNTNLIVQYDLSSNYTTFNYYFNNLLVKTYFLNATFTPYQTNNYGMGYSVTRQLIVRPIVFYSIPFTDIIYERTSIVYSVIPFTDQSGGIFNIIDFVGTAVQDSLVTINSLNGQIGFLTNINVNSYTFTIIYTLNNTSNQTFYNLIVRPVVYYPNNYTSLLYSISGVSNSPYANQPNGLYTISSTLRNLVSINSNTGIINFSNLCPINNYTLNITYVLNRISNSTQYLLNVKPIINYSPNSIATNYLTSAVSTAPQVNLPGGSFVIIDISTNLVSTNQVSINSLGIINFNNTIPVGFYNFIITYTYNNISNTTNYSLLARPYLAYPETFKLIEYEHTIYDASSIPIYLPQGGIFTIIDISGTLINENLVTINSVNGQLLFLNNINPNSYIFMITYLYNSSNRFVNYTLQVKPTIRYNVNRIVLLYNTSGSSISPYTNPANGTYSIYELDNILVQLNFVNINYLTGIINFLSGINPGIYNFGINYNLNNIISTTYYNLQVIPTISYSPNSLVLLYDVSGNSIIPNYSPLNGVFTISSNIINYSLFRINRNGSIFFSNGINVGLYNLLIIYSLNSVFNTTNYQLTIRPRIQYTIASSTLLYQRNVPNYSVRPIVLQNNGQYNIYDSSNNLIYLVPNYVSIDLSGVICFQPNINVGLYSFIIYYTLNNISNYTFYNLIIKPNISYPIGSVSLLYDRPTNYNTEAAFVDQSGGTFVINSSLASIDNLGSITFFPLINVGFYNFIITYTLLNSFNTTIYSLTVRPNIYYTISSIINNYGQTVSSIGPYYQQQGGIFTLYDLSNSNIVQINYASINQIGIILFNKLISVGTYNLLIVYSLNSISNQTRFNYTVIPNVSYSVAKTILLYDTSGLSVSPTYSELYGLFTINTNNSNININQNTGIIYFNNGINVGIYNFIITYTLNRISNTTSYELNVLPTIDYTDKNNILLYDRITPSYSTLPIYNQKDGIFSINDNVGYLVQNNYVFIDISSGLITINTLIDVGIYSFIVTYFLNNLSNTVIYNLTIIPNVLYTPSSQTINYNTSGTSTIPYYNQPNGNFSITDSIGNLVATNFVNINVNNGLITFIKGIAVGYYLLIITYTLNGLSNTTSYQLYVIPSVSYSINIKNLNYGTSGQSINPTLNQYKGKFYIYDLSNNAVQQTGASININTGIISFTNYINVGIYTLTVQYQLNNVSGYTLYFLNVYPTITYSSNIQQILYNRPSEITSPIPIVQQSGGQFYLSDLSNNTLVSSNLIYIGLSGVIYYLNNINVGSYIFSVTYTLNNLSSNINYNLQVIPNLVYQNPFNILNYGTEYATPSPYYDQSGGLFSFTDISGILISNNIITYDISAGSFYFNKLPDVGLYNFKVTYSLNLVSNFVNFIFYILPTINYSVSSSTYIYNTNNYSVAPVVQQPGGKFSITSRNGVYIDTSFGIINVSYGAYVDSYSLTVTYSLNSVFNTTIYNFIVKPIIDYNYPYLQAQYNTFTQSQPAIYDPPNGTFLLLPNINDISNYNIVNYDISYGLIYIDPSNGQLSFSENLYVGIYNLTVFYTFNNITNNVNFQYIMQPYLNYNPPYLSTNYHDISFSVVPTVAPLGGVFRASVSLINIIYTGISINSKTGVLRFGLINAGQWYIQVKYTINGVSTVITYNLKVLASIVYNPPFSVIPLNITYSTQPPTATIPNGEYSSTTAITGFSINSTTGILTFINIVAGVYNIDVIYTVFGTEVILNYTLVVQPTIIYNPSFINVYYTNPGQSVSPFASPLGGVYDSTFNDANLSPLLSSITISTLSGIINTTSALRVGIYNLLVNYTINGSTITIPYTINIYPNFNYSIGSQIVKYGDVNNSEIPLTNPNQGVFSTNSIFYVSSINGQILFNNTTNVGVYNIPVIYTYNDLQNIQIYRLTVNPIYYYNVNSIEVIINNGAQSEKPTAKQSLGIFSYVSVSGTLPIPYGTSFLSSGDQYISNGVILNGFTGILNFGDKILVGYYNFVFAYTLYNLSAYSAYSIIVRPYLNYPLSNLVLDYNTSALSSIPIVDQSGGFFYFSDLGNLVLQSNRVTINNKTGVINFIGGINVGYYKIIITYIVKQISNFQPFYLTVRPIFYYANAQTTIVVGSIGYSNSPTVIQSGGIFSTNNDIYIDPITGILSFINILIGNYNYVIKYTLNNSSVETTYNLIVLPYVSYDINSLVLPYSLQGSSQVPFVSYYGGIFTLDDVTSLGIMSSKVSIDISSGQINFKSFINSGYYTITVGYRYNNIKNTVPYYLSVLPLFEYSISGVVLDYNHLPFSSVVPTSNPTRGLYYFSDNSNNYPIKQITLNKTTGVINITKLMVGNYNIGIKYYLKQFVTPNRYIISILPTFYYSINSLTFTYSEGYIYSVIPFVDPSGGIFNIAYPINNNLTYNININTNGQLKINRLTEINSYSFNVIYTYNNNNTFANYNLLVKPLFTYNESEIRIFYGRVGYSSLPNYYPTNGLFAINNININNQVLVNSISGLFIDQYTGLIYINNNLPVSSYNLNISYTYLNISTYFNYLVQIISKFSYDVSGQTIIYGYQYYSGSPLTDIPYGLYQVDPVYNSVGIYIDASSGILTFKPNINVNYYPIIISYTFLDIIEYFTYNLLVIPEIYYDISNLIINYGTTYYSKRPIINPFNGQFSINYGVITLSGNFIIDNFDVNNYKLQIGYKINNIFNYYYINLTIKPVIYYDNLSIIVFSVNSSSSSPYTSPNNGSFYLDISNISIQDNGIINFDPNQNIGKYLLKVYYNVNNIIQSTYYNYIIIPYLYYNESGTSIVGGTAGNSSIPIVRPTGGKFNLVNNNIFIDTSGVIFIDSNLDVGIYDLVVNYNIIDLSNNFNYRMTVTPYIYYNDAIYNFGVNDQSERPINNSYGGRFYLTFDPQTTIQINLINIDISSGIIYFSSGLKVDQYYFYVNYLRNNLLYRHTYNFIIQPVIVYPDFNINYNTSFNGLPLFINPTGGTFSSNNLPYFITLNNTTGEINISNTILVGKYNFIVEYMVNNISSFVQVNVNLIPIISYNPLTITYLDIGSIEPSYVSISGGIFISNNIPNSLLLDRDTGKFTYNTGINVDYYKIKVIYLINDVSGFNFFELTVKPYLNYNSPSIIVYGQTGTSVIPDINPNGGVFSLVNFYTNITIDPTYGIISYGSNIPVNYYEIDTQYTYNNITTQFKTELLVNVRTLSVNFVAKDKVYDGTSNVIFKSNKMTGVINDDKVFIQSYNSNFQTIGPGINIPVFVYDLVLGGSDSNNYILQYDNLASGNIFLSKYQPNYLKVNKGTAGNSTIPLLSYNLINPLFLISNITTTISGYINNNSITINPYGIIEWDDTLDISIYNITVTVYNVTTSEDILYTLEVTTNLFTGELNVDPPSIPNTSVESSAYQLQYSSTEGNAYVLDDNITGLVAKFEITAYNSSDNILHDLGSEYPFTFQLDNADTSATLFTYELNDDGTVNYSVGYELVFAGGNSWTAYLKYLSDFIVQDVTALPNTDPTFDPTPGEYKTSTFILVNINALPNSKIYYTIDGSIPTINSPIYSSPIQISSGSLTIKAFAITPGHINSNISTGTYTVQQVPCLLSKTLIRTPYGNELIDNLKDGDLIVTGDNRIVPIVSILKYKIEYPDDKSYPICIPKDYFGKNVPDRNTYISQNHAIRIEDSKWIYGGHHLKYFDIYRVKPLYYHILLPNYFRDDLIANNLVVESWSGMDPKNGLVNYRYKSIININTKEYHIFEKYIITSILKYKKIIKPKVII